jgi:DNA-binding CsgD family transcriptional regulator
MIEPGRELQELQHAPDVAEAYIRMGRAPDAERIVEAFSQWAKPSGLTGAQLERCRGLLARDKTFDRHFLDALELHRLGSFEQARTGLCYGERLRRAGRRRDAREQLRPALETFERLGAAPWAERARAELRATGERLRAREPAREELTAQELRIALQATEGKTNRQIAATMFLSPKTVEFHLSRAYRKLGVSSRAELIRHFAAGPAVPEPAGVAND